MTEENTQNAPAPVTDWKQRELGALWRREGKNQNFLSGMIRVGDPLGADSVKEIKVVVFTNKGKAKNERAPDFIIYQDTPREDAPREEAPIISEAPETDSDLPDSLR